MSKQIAKLSPLKLTDPHCRLPVSAVDELDVNIGTLCLVGWKANQVLNRLGDHYYDPQRRCGAIEEAESDLSGLGELPSNMATTLEMFAHGMQTATTEQIADGITVLHGLFASQGDPQIMATAGVAIIEAEHASAIALYSTVLAMLRPPRKTRKHEWDGLERPPLRRFLPTIPEIIAELQDQQEKWALRHEQLKGLLERHGQARQALIKRVTELRERQRNKNGTQRMEPPAEYPQRACGP